MNEVPVNIRNAHQDNQHGHYVKQEQYVPKKRGGGFKMFLKILFLLVFISAIFFGGFFAFDKYKKQTKAATFIDQGKYQAVFLSNGQIYFGKVSKEREQYVSLSDVHYLVLKQPLQSQTNQENSEQAKNNSPEYTLVKLGKETHGPLDMTINREQILFIENLSDDSKVVSAIKGKK